MLFRSATPPNGGGARVSYRLLRAAVVTTSPQKAMANNADILRFIDSIARDKEIDKESLIVSIEQAMLQALAKKYGVDDVEVHLDRETGAFDCNYDVSMEDQGRIFAMSVKQAIMSRVREAERDVIYNEFEQKLGEIVSGTVQRFEGDTVIVNLGRNIEGILPRAEKVRSESYNTGERIRAMILEVKKVGPRVKVILSRAHRDPGERNPYENLERMQDLFQKTTITSPLSGVITYSASAATPTPRSTRLPCRDRPVSPSASAIVAMLSPLVEQSECWPRRHW